MIARERDGGRGGGWGVAAALGLGIAVGLGVHALAPAPEVARRVADGFGLLSQLFLRLVRMVVAPLVFASVAAALAGLGGDGRMTGRLLARTLGWFALASLLSLGIGLLGGNLLRPGAGLGLVPSGGGVAAAAAVSPEEMLLRAVPDSVVGAMARNEILPITVFAALFGIAVGGLAPPARERMVVLLGDASQAMLRMTGLVMRGAPLGVFGAVAAVLAGHGTGMLAAYGRFAAGYAVGLVVLWAVLVGAAAAVLGRERAWALLRTLRGPMLVAFGTASGEAAYLRTLERLLGFGVAERVAGLVLPLGLAFNLDGAMLYHGFAALFVAQAYGIALPLPQQAALGLTLLLAGKGTAGVPRAAIVVLAAVLPGFGLPAAGVTMLLGIDPFLDMGRSATNVLGNGIAAAVVGKWEKGAPDAGPAGGAGGG